MKRVTIIGCGNMGGAIARGLCLKHKDASQWLTLCDASLEKLELFKKEFSVTISTDPVDSIKEASIIVFALKPYVVLDVLEELKKALNDKPTPLLISVAAGIKISQMKDLLKNQVSYARVMPNLPCLIAEGISGAYAESDADYSVVERIFSTVGEVVRVEKESDLNTVTGLSGSGPAFAFYLIDALAKGAVEKGLSQELAQKLACQTVIGSAKLLSGDGKTPAELIDQVTTPGGTTLAGLEVLKNKKVEEALKGAVIAATDRAIELGKE